MVGSILFMLVAASNCDPETVRRPPNVLLIVADDMRADSIVALGNRSISTPHLDRLAARGLVFRNAYCLGGNSAAVCTPSRNMLLSGQSFFRWNGSAQAPGDPPHLPWSLEQAGYATFHSGKRHNVASHIQAHFDTNIVSEDDDAERRSGEPGKAQIDDAIRFLQARSDNPHRPPFFMFLAPGVPHDPRVPHPVDRQHYAATHIRLPANYLPQHPFDNGEMSVRDELLLPIPRTEEAIRETIRDYYATITGFDRHLGRLFQKLDELQLTSETLVIFTADQGISIGSHGLLGKQNLYEHAMKVPLILAGPGVPAGQAEGLVYLLDLYPTICAYTGVPIPAGLDGQSFLPVLRDPASAARHEILLAYRDVQRAWRDARWKIICYPQADVTQLFDLQSDPDELMDLAKSANDAPRIAPMLQKLRAAQAHFGDRLALKRPIESAVCSGYRNPTLQRGNWATTLREPKHRAGSDP